MVIIYQFCDYSLPCSYSLIYWAKTDNYWTKTEGYPTWDDETLYEYYTHFTVIEAPKEDK